MPLRQLYPDPSRTHESPGSIRVDIIAVHGLNWRGKPDADHAWDTWRTPDGPTGHVWLREELPQRIPDCRVFLYEWNSSLLLSKARDGWTDKAREFLDSIIRVRAGVGPERPIIFFGHSMGGLLVKQALVNASIDPFYWSIRDSTSGIAFFATPHQGARRLLVGLGGFASAAARKFRFRRSRSDLIDVLDGTGLSKDLLQEQWKPHLLRYHIVSFWGSKDQYVPESSARFNLPRDREAIVKLNADHRDVCKFRPGDPVSQDNLALVLFHIYDLYRKALGTRGHLTDTIPVSRAASPVYEVAGETSASPPCLIPLNDEGNTRTEAAFAPETASSSTPTSPHPVIPHSSTSSPVSPGNRHIPTENPSSTPLVTTAGNGISSNASASDPSPATILNERGTGDILSDSAAVAGLISSIAEGAVSPNDIWSHLNDVLTPSEDEALESMLLLRSLRKSVTPDIASLWVKTCISAGALGMFIHNLEIFKAKLSKSNPSKLRDISKEELEAMMHHTLALHHLRFLASSPPEALAALERLEYPWKSGQVKEQAIIRGGVLLSSIAATWYLVSTITQNNTPEGRGRGDAEPHAQLDEQQPLSTAAASGAVLENPGLNSNLSLGVLASSLAIVASMGGYTARTMTILRKEWEAVLDLDMEMHKLNYALSDYEVTVAILAYQWTTTSTTTTSDSGPSTSTSPPPPPTARGPSPSQGREPATPQTNNLSKLKQDFLRNFGIDLDELQKKTRTYDKYLLLDRLDSVVRCFQRYDQQLFVVAKTLDLPLPNDVVGMSKLGDRAALLRGATRKRELVTEEAAGLEDNGGDYVVDFEI